MFEVRAASFLMIVAGLSAGLSACGEVVGYPGAPPPAHTRTYPTAQASPLPAGVDPLTALRQRPVRPPATPAGACYVSSNGDLGSVAPNYGAGVGPVYLSGQDSWYSAGQAAILMVDSRYSGPLLIRTLQLDGGGMSTVTLEDFPQSSSGVDEKERSHGVNVVPAVKTADGGLYLAAVPSSSYWRAWIGRLSTSSQGCFGLQVDGDVFTEDIVFEVNPGTPPPG